MKCMDCVADGLEWEFGEMSNTRWTKRCTMRAIVLWSPEFDETAHHNGIEISANKVDNRNLKDQKTTNRIKANG